MYIKYINVCYTHEHGGFFLNAEYAIFQQQINKICNILELQSKFFLTKKKNNFFKNNKRIKKKYIKIEIQRLRKCSIFFITSV